MLEALVDSFHVTVWRHGIEDQSWSKFIKRMTQTGHIKSWVALYDSHRTASSKRMKINRGTALESAGLFLSFHIECNARWINPRLELIAFTFTLLPLRSNGEPLVSATDFARNHQYIQFLSDILTMRDGSLEEKLPQYRIEASKKLGQCMYEIDHAT